MNIGSDDSIAPRTTNGTARRSRPEDLRALDWRFFLSRYVWRSALVGPHAPAEVVAALTLSVEGLRFHGTEEHQRGMDLSDVELVVLGMEDVHAFATVASRGDLPKHACAVVFEPGWVLAASGGGGRTGGTLGRVSRLVLPHAARPDYPAEWPFARRFDLAHALLSDDYRVVHYPVASPRVRDFVWNTLSPPRTWKGSLARTRVWPLPQGVLPLLRERRVTVWAEETCLHPRATSMMVMAGELGENNPAVVLDLGDEAAGPTFPLAASGNGPRLTKIARSMGGGASLQRERRKLDRLALRRPALERTAMDLRPGWPELPCLEQPAILGNPLDRLPDADRIDAVYRFASSHSDLGRAERALVREGVVHPPRIEDWMQSVVTAARRHLPLRPPEDEFLEALPSALAAAGLALGFRQQDAHFRNVLVEHRQPRLIDWGSGGWALPGDDLVYLVAQLLFHEAGRPYSLHEVWVIERLLIDPLTRPVWATEVLRRLARELKIGRGAFGLLLSSIWLRRAVRWVFEVRREPHRTTEVALHVAAWRALRDAGPQAWADVSPRP